MVASHRTVGHCLPHRHSRGGKELVSLKNALDATVQISSLLKSQPWSTYDLTILWNKTGRIPKAEALQLKFICIPWLTVGGARVPQFELQAELATFSMTHNFHLKERLTDNCGYSVLSI